MNLQSQLTLFMIVDHDRWTQESLPKIQVRRLLIFHACACHKSLCFNSMLPLNIPVSATCVYLQTRKCLGPNTEPRLASPPNKIIVQSQVYTTPEVRSSAHFFSTRLASQRARNNHHQIEIPQVPSASPAPNSSQQHTHSFSVVVTKLQRWEILV